MIIKCSACNVEYKRQIAKPCNDGMFRCKRCSNKFRNRKYAKTDNAKATTLKWREQHRDEATQRSTQWIKENPKRRKEIEAKYRVSEKGKTSAIKRTMKHYWADPEFQRKKAIARIHGVTPDFITELRKRQPVCQLCGTSNDLTVDHMNPVSNGGKAIEGNVQSLCGPCNSWKSNKLFLADGSGYMVGYK